jgi:hypothetical protein
VRINKIFQDYDGNMLKTYRGKIYNLKNHLEKLIGSFTFYINIQQRLMNILSKLAPSRKTCRRKRKYSKKS